MDWWIHACMSVIEVISAAGTPIKPPSMSEKLAVPSLDLKWMGDRPATHQAEKSSVGVSVAANPLLKGTEAESRTPKTGKAWHLCLLLVKSTYELLSQLCQTYEYR